MWACTRTHAERCWLKETLINSALMGMSRLTAGDGGAESWGLTECPSSGDIAMVIYPPLHQRWAAAFPNWKRERKKVRERQLGNPLERILMNSDMIDFSQNLKWDRQSLLFFPQLWRASVTQIRWMSCCYLWGGLSVCGSVCGVW